MKKSNLKKGVSFHSTNDLEMMAPSGRSTHAVTLDNTQMNSRIGGNSMNLDFSHYVVLLNGTSDTDEGSSWNI
jgi:hypothetical protein